MSSKRLSESAKRASEMKKAGTQHWAGQDSIAKTLDSIKGTSTNVRGLTSFDGYGGVNSTTMNWAGQIGDLKAALEQTDEYVKDLQFKIEADEGTTALATRHAFNHILKQISSDIRFFSGQFREYLELPKEGGEAKSWDLMLTQIDSRVKEISVGAVGGGEEQCFQSMARLLALRDACMESLLHGIIYQRAVLDWDLKTKRDYAGAISVHFSFSLKFHHYI